MSTQSPPDPDANAPQLPGMGAIPIVRGIAFRIWAPLAERVTVVGSFNDWDASANPLQRDDDGNWYAEIPEAAGGDEYKFFITTGGETFLRTDPYDNEVTIPSP